jgi:heat shock protein HslJ
MRHKTALSLILSALFVVGACAGAANSPGPSDGDPGGNDPQGIDGRTFLSTKVEGQTLVAGSTIRLSFNGTNIGLSAGCNSMGGRFAVDGDRLLTDQMGGTDMACDPALMDQDRWVSEFLNGATIALDGDTLTLTRGDTRLTLTDREVADPDRPLLGTRWVLDGIISGDAVSSVPVGVNASLVFSEGQVDVEAGCNTGSGGIQVVDNTITVSGIALTKMACEADAMTVEGAMGAVLNGTIVYEIEAGVLTLRTANAGLTFRAAP